MIQISCCNFKESVYIFCHKSLKWYFCNGIEPVHYSRLNFRFQDTPDFKYMSQNTCSTWRLTLQKFSRFSFLYKPYMRNYPSWSQWGFAIAFRISFLILAFFLPLSSGDRLFLISFPAGSTWQWLAWPHTVRSNIRQETGMCSHGQALPASSTLPINHLT